MMVKSTALEILYVSGRLRSFDHQQETGGIADLRKAIVRFFPIDAPAEPYPVYSGRLDRRVMTGKLFAGTLMRRTTPHLTMDRKCGVVASWTSVTVEIDLSTGPIANVWRTTQFTIAHRGPMLPVDFSVVVGCKATHRHSPHALAARCTSSGLRRHAYWTSRDSRLAARTTMMVITTRSSTSVNPRGGREDDGL